MIKLLLTGGTPVTIWINPQHLAEVIERSDHTSTIRLMNGNTYQVHECGQIINDQVVAWQHRTKS